MSLVNDSISQNFERGLDLRLRRQHLLSTNVANADTPGYIPQDLEFEGALSDAAAVDVAKPMAQTNSRHMQAGGLPTELVASRAVERPDVGDTLDGNAVDMDKEMARSVDNSLRYKATLELVRRRYGLIKQTVSDLARV